MSKEYGVKLKQSFIVPHSSEDSAREAARRDGWELVSREVSEWRAEA